MVKKKRIKVKGLRYACCTFNLQDPGEEIKKSIPTWQKESANIDNLLVAHLIIDLVCGVRLHCNISFSHVL